MSSCLFVWLCLSEGCAAVVCLRVGLFEGKSRELCVAPRVCVCARADVDGLDEAGELDPLVEVRAVEKGQMTPRYVIHRPFTRHDSIGGDSTDSGFRGGRHSVHSEGTGGRRAHAHTPALTGC